ncbi:MAG: ATP-dependent RecD-like DNA helicase [Clostridia bacterium]|nr:ATP-dependent RecD-like DNA helicase [Clostridia bacterium]
MAELERDTLSGTVERVVFRNPENGWTVLDLDAGETLEKVVGTFADVHVGEQLIMQGDWVEHPKFGRQFRMESHSSRLPTDTLAILRYLSSGAIRGIGPATAARVIDKFGDDALRILEEEPIRLSEVRGITREKAKKLGEEFQAQSGLRELMLTFATYGLTQSEAVRCWKRFGTSAVSRIRENPYVLCNAGLSIPFERADRLAAALHGEGNTPQRIEAGLLYVLRHNLGNGHTCLPSDKLVQAAAGMLGAPEPETAEVLERMQHERVVLTETIGERLFVFLPTYHAAEQYTTARLRRMLKNKPEEDTPDEQIDRIEKRLKIRYATQQRAALTAALQNRIFILTGGPGTGKTTTVNGMIALLEQRGEAVALAAPTGRAAKRMTELSGREAKTLHRLLEVQWNDEEEPVFARDEKNPLEADTVIVDELSMVDAMLFEKLLRALRHDCRLILVGDADQLPAVGAGSVLQNLLSVGMIPTVQLTEVFRQALESQIVTGAHAVLAGDMPRMNEKSGDFFFMKRPSVPAVQETILELCSRRLPDTYGVSCWNGLQVLCPGRRQALGTEEMNLLLQNLLNPSDSEKNEMKSGNRILRVGDKVMHNRNNYDIIWTRDNGEVGSGVFNGDIGILEKVNRREETASVRYDDRVALYTKEDLKDLELAYAITVHKSQGSEFDAVVLTMFRHQKQLCYRNLLYTAITRAKKMLIVVGDEQTMGEMIENNRKTLRYSGLSHFLTLTDDVGEWPG